MKPLQRTPTGSEGTGHDDVMAETPQEEAQEQAQTENPAQPGLALPDDAVNLVPILLEAAESDPAIEKFITTELPQQVIKAFNEDWESRSGWMSKRAEITNLFLGALKEKQEPWRNCANMHVPILSTRILRLVSRVWAEVHAAGQPFFSAHAGSQLSEEKADIITKHENWQFSKEIPDFPSQTWRYWMDFFLFGEGVFESYRDFSKNVNRHEYVSPDEFVYPYVRRTVAPDMSDVPRKTKILWRYKRDLQQMKKLGFWAQVDKVIAKEGTHESTVDDPTKDAVDSFEKRDRKESTIDAPYMLLEQHTWVKLPGRDEEEPFIVTVDTRTKRVLSLTSRYYDDPEDRGRFEDQTRDYEEYMALMGQYAQILEEEQATLSSLQQPGVPPEEAVEVAEAVQRDRPEPPMRPQWMQDDEEGNPKPPEPCRRKIIERFSRGACIDIPNNSYGIGLGVLLLPHQMAANIMMNQFIDAGTLANSNTVVTHDMVKFPSGMTSISPNEVIKVRGVPPDQIEKSFYKFDHPAANSQLVTGVQQQEAAADGIASAPAVLSGEREGDETFRGQATRVEQATKQMSALTSKGMLALNQVAKNNAALNFQFLPDSKNVDARDPATGKLTPILVTRDMYRDSFDISFSADLSFASRATKVAEADDALGLLTKGLPPQLLTMAFKPGVVAAAAKKCLQARGMFDLAAYALSDAEIEMAQQQQAMMAAQAGPGGPPGQPGMGPPSIPTGQPQMTPGTVEPQSQIPEGTPSQAAPPNVH